MFPETTSKYTAQLSGLFPGYKISLFIWCNVKRLVSFSWFKYSSRPGKTEVLAKDRFADKEKTDKDKQERFIHVTGISVDDITNLRIFGNRLRNAR